MPEPASGVCLSVRGLTKRIGGFYPLRDLDMDVACGHIHAVIGPNGAGKTTFFNLLSGVLAAESGQITFEGRAIDRDPLDADASAAGEILKCIERVDHLSFLADFFQPFMDLIHCPACFVRECRG